MHARGNFQNTKSQAIVPPPAGAEADAADAVDADAADADDADAADADDADAADAGNAADADAADAANAVDADAADADDADAADAGERTGIHVHVQLELESFRTQAHCCDAKRDCCELVRCKLQGLRCKVQGLRNIVRKAVWTDNCMVFEGFKIKIASVGNQLNLAEI